MRASSRPMLVSSGALASPVKAPSSRNCAMPSAIARLDGGSMNGNLHAAA